MDYPATSPVNPTWHGAEKLLREMYQATADNARDVSTGRSLNKPRERLSRRFVPSSTETRSAKDLTELKRASKMRQDSFSPNAAVAEAPLKVEPHERTRQEQVMAALTVAEQVRAAEAPKPRAQSNEALGANTSSTGESKTSTLVALLISSADTKSVAAL